MAMDCHLVLTTLSGTVVEMSSSVAQYDRFEDFEEHVVDYLAWATDLDVFGCALDFIHPTVQTYLDDPIWETLQNIKQYTIVFRDCFEAFHTKEAFDTRCWSSCLAKLSSSPDCQDAEYCRAY